MDVQESLEYERQVALDKIRDQIKEQRDRIKHVIRTLFPGFNEDEVEAALRAYIGKRI